MTSLDALTDEELMERLKADEIDAYRVLYQRYKRTMYAYILQIVRNDEVAKDVFQTVFADIFEHRRQFTYGTFRAWMYTIARNASMKAWTKEAPSRAGRGIADPPELADEGDRTGADVLLSNALHNALNQLTPEFQQAIQLRYYDDLSFEEIADRLNISLSLAKVRVTRAKQALRTLLMPLSSEVMI
ncbi:MAG: sigma-70 family RNA polymerase sigma factor [Bacteroidetes bacterium]|nr:sigma-70 family RNA polymerase sigma factor [Bacteroidota bacterium]